MKKIILIAVLGILLSCGKSDDKYFVQPQNYNIVNGFDITDANGVPIGTIGMGQTHFDYEVEAEGNGNDIQYYEGVYAPYPNPTFYRESRTGDLHCSITFRYNLAIESSVTAWIENAYPSEYINLQTDRTFENQEKSKQIVKELIDESLESGRYSYRWDAKDESGNFCEPGFYRCYVKINENVYFRDFLVLGDLVPAFFQDYYYYGN